MEDKQKKRIALLSGILFSVAVLIVKLVKDMHLWQKGIRVNHQKEWRIMAVGSLAGIAALTYASSLPWYLGAILSAALVAFFILNFFNGGYNILRKQKWAFTGDGGPHGSKTDKILAKYPASVRILIQAVPFAALVVTYIIYL